MFINISNMHGNILSKHINCLYFHTVLKSLLWAKKKFQVLCLYIRLGSLMWGVAHLFICIQTVNVGQAWRRRTYPWCSYTGSPDTSWHICYFPLLLLCFHIENTLQMQKTAWQNHKMGRRRRPPCPLPLTASTKCSYTQSHCTFIFSCTSVKLCCIVTVQCWHNCLQRLCLSRYFLKYLKLPLWSQGSDFCCDDMDRHADWLRR